MRLSFSSKAFLALLASGLASLSLADSSNAPTFFGSSSQSTAMPAKPSVPKPSPSQVWSKDQFSKQVDTLKANNQAQYEQNLNAKLKPMPTQGQPSTSNPQATMPAYNSPPQNANTPPPPPPRNAPPQGSTPPQGYTGFTGQQPTQNSGSQKQSGWGINY